MGLTSRGFNFTACSNFKPTVLTGQLCYSLDLSAITGIKTQVGPNFGLMMVLDPGRVENEDNEEKEVSEIVSMDLQPVSAATSSAKIYLNTLESFTDFRAGTYALSVLKKMTGTQSFLKMADKPCQLEVFEDCENQRYLEEVKKHCGCVPWALSSALTLQVDASICQVFQ